MLTTTMTDSKSEQESRTSVVSASVDEDDRELEALGYVPSFKREFTNLATVCLSLNA